MEKEEHARKSVTSVKNNRKRKRLKSHSETEQPNKGSQVYLQPSFFFVDPSTNFYLFFLLLRMEILLIVDHKCVIELCVCVNMTMLSQCSTFRQFHFGLNSRFEIPASDLNRWHIFAGVLNCTHRFIYNTDTI